MTDYARATIIDVAERAGVSIATVSRVMNRAGTVAETTAAKVWDAISELNYSPHAAARGLASRRTNTLGLIVREISGEFFQPMLRGIESAACENGFDLLIHCTQRVVDLNTLPHHLLSEHNSDGLLVFTNSLEDSEIIRLHSAQFPLVLLHRSPPADLEIPCITVENKAGARRMVDYLIEQRGYRRIAFLAGPPESEDALWREMGYRESLAAHNIPFDAALVGIGGFDEQVAHQAASQLLQAGTQIDAIFAADDDSAVGTLAAAKEAGLRVPEDIAVVGFDDISLARHLNPPLTTVRAPIEQAGREAVRQLINLIRTGNVERLILLPTELVIRRSCGSVEI